MGWARVLLFFGELERVTRDELFGCFLRGSDWQPVPRDFTAVEVLASGAILADSEAWTLWLMRVVRTPIACCSVTGGDWKPV